MPTYISHITWTEQGIRSVKDSPKRLDAVKKQLKTLGGELKAFYMTQGTYDALLIFEVPNDTVLAKLLLHVRSEEHTSELQSQSNLVCRLLLEKKKKQLNNTSKQIALTAIARFTTMCNTL